MAGENIAAEVMMKWRRVSMAKDPLSNP